MIVLMNGSHIPSPARFRQQMLKLSIPEMRSLCERTGVPYQTAYKLRTGETTDPRLSTVHALWPHVAGRRRASPVVGSDQAREGFIVRSRGIRSK